MRNVLFAPIYRNWWPIARQPPAGGCLRAQRSELRKCVGASGRPSRWGAHAVSGICRRRTGAGLKVVVLDKLKELEDVLVTGNQATCQRTN